MAIAMQDQEKDNEKPPSCLPRPAHPWRVAVLANIKEHDKPLPADVPPDAGADYDYIETIDYIRVRMKQREKWLRHRKTELRRKPKRTTRQSV
jgi:hypothetical protein